MLIYYTKRFKQKQISFSIQFSFNLEHASVYS